ncbi:hypothetical protein ACH4C2_27885 [Streptomyces sp. NPDC018057]|uniref:hypothetical protein n=1 Tax=unclassified Streptomyces TaxID=2593676 RepID=UPI00378A0388
MTGYAPDALLVAAVLVSVWLLVTVVRYVRADRGTRVSMRQAVRVRWGWVRLARMVGLTVTDKTPSLLAQLTAQKDGPAPAPRVLTPKIKVTPDRFGVIVRARTLPQVGLEEYQKSARFLADAWRCTRVSVLPDGPGKVVIRGVRSDPLTTPTEHRPTGRPPTDLTRWELGVDEYAAQVCVSLANVPGVTMAGVPGAGKTSGVNKYLAPAPVRAAHPRVEHRRTPADRTLQPRLSRHRRPAPAARLGPSRARLPRPVPHPHPPCPTSGGRRPRL